MDFGEKPLPRSEKGDVVLSMPSEDHSKTIESSSASAVSSPFSQTAAAPTNWPPKESDSSIPEPLQLNRLKSDVRVSTFMRSPSPDNTNLAPSANKPPRPRSDTLTRRGTLSRSGFSKPKSRFVEQSYPSSAATPLEEYDDSSGNNHPTNSSHPNSPYRVPAATPKETSKTAATPKTPYSVGDEDEVEIIRKYVPPHQKWRQRLKFWVLLEWVALVSVAGLLVASLTVHKLQTFVIWGLHLWKWCLMVIVIFCGRLFTEWFITILVFFLEMNFMLKRKVLYFVYGLKGSVRVCIWSALILLTWLLLFDHGIERSRKTRKFLDSVSRTLASVFIGSVIWLVKTLLLKLLASSFHVNRFFDRIQESIFHQYILQTLSGPPLMEMAEKIGATASTRSTVQLSFRSGKKGKGGEEEDVIDIAKLQKMKQGKVSALTMKRLVNTITSSSLWTISNTLDESAYEDANEQKDVEINSELEAKELLIKFFGMSPSLIASKKSVLVCKVTTIIYLHILLISDVYWYLGTRHIDEEDLQRFLTKEEMETVLPQFEGAVETRKIKKAVLTNWVVKVYLERKSLAHSLNDTKTVVKQFDKLVSVLLIVVILIIWLLMLGVATTKLLLVISSQLLVLGFMFQNSCKILFEAIIFVFVMHPFDVGDRCVIDGVQMIVEEMNILTTVFLRFDNEKIYYPNSVLATKPISNFYRSPDMSDTVEFSVDVSTPMDSIKALKDRIKIYIENKPEHWYSKHSVVVKEIEDLNKMKMALIVQHTMNYQNMGEKNGRRSELVLEMKKIFEELGIKYHLLPQAVHLTYVAGLPMHSGR